MFGPFRLRVNAPTRHPEDRPSKLPVHIRLSGGEIVTKHVDIDDHPLYLFLPRFDAPGILAGLAPTTTLPWAPRWWRVMLHEEGRKLVEQHGGTGLKIGPIKT